jgi:hypothetical protein
MIGHFQRGLRPLRAAPRFGNEGGLTSTVSLLPGFERFGAIGLKDADFETSRDLRKLGGAYMRIDRYTKTILTIIALLLAVIALRPFFQPQATLADDRDYARVQFSYSGGNHAFFDTRSGDVWEYGDKGQFRQHYKVHEFGKDHDHDRGH